MHFTSETEFNTSMRTILEALRDGTIPVDLNGLLEDLFRSNVHIELYISAIVDKDFNAAIDLLHAVLPTHTLNLGGNKMSGFSAELRESDNEIKQWYHCSAALPPSWAVVRAIMEKAAKALDTRD